MCNDLYLKQHKETRCRACVSWRFLQSNLTVITESLFATTLNKKYFPSCSRPNGTGEVTTAPERLPLVACQDGSTWCWASIEKRFTFERTMDTDKEKAHFACCIVAGTTGFGKEHAKYSRKLLLLKQLRGDRCDSITSATLPLICQTASQSQRATCSSSDTVAWKHVHKHVFYLQLSVHSTS